MSKNSECRGCGKKLNGDGSQMSSVYDPITKEASRWNYYGGWVCSKTCDYNSSLELERSMPGHRGQQHLIICSASYRSVETNWK